MLALQVFSYLNRYVPTLLIYSTCSFRKNQVSIDSNYFRLIIFSCRLFSVRKSDPSIFILFNPLYKCCFIRTIISGTFIKIHDWFFSWTSLSYLASFNGFHFAQIIKLYDVKYLIRILAWCTISITFPSITVAPSSYSTLAIKWPSKIAYSSKQLPIYSTQ